MEQMYSIYRKLFQIKTDCGQAARFRDSIVLAAAAASVIVAATAATVVTAAAAENENKQNDAAASVAVTKEIHTRLPPFVYSTYYYERKKWLRFLWIKR